MKKPLLCCPKTTFNNVIGQNQNSSLYAQFTLKVNFAFVHLARMS
ncbi:hypothetical protein PAGA_b0390 [Pseudoalteromonas agarivorans DSM 14585]|uniref:Uncharacterized protein n=1 Tax=Pseudoalteromonas agarivorans DSM 14585 TaxID=1312369 RepID=A0ACA8E218_9GAMM|nr:hypothetical protein PAGA_b0390 [Pseudoalteromonas agarivorans DSM 14585]